MQSFGRSLGLLKTHKYETQADLINLTPEQIVRIPPTDIGNYIENETGNVTLDTYQMKALSRLLSFKQNIPKNRAVPESMIEEFLYTLPNRVKEAAAYKQEVKSDLDFQSLKRRNDALGDIPPEPVTQKEALQRKWVNLGGKTKRKGRKYKTKRNRKTNHYRKRKTKRVSIK
jgi:hypothetical protein